MLWIKLIPRLIFCLILGKGQVNHHYITHSLFHQPGIFLIEQVTLFNNNSKYCLLMSEIKIRSGKQNFTPIITGMSYTVHTGAVETRIRVYSR
jgi:hypothetical protein